MVELAAGFGVLFACVSGVASYGYSMYVYDCLEVAVTSGAMYASRATLDTRNTNFATEVVNMVVYGNPQGTGTPAVPGLDASKVAVTMTPSTGFPNTITVSLTSVTVNTVFRTFTFTGKPSVTVRFSGEYFTPEP
jgi:Flp pilus assembly protein TadG